MTLERLLRESWARHAARVAVDGDRRLTYAALEREVTALAERLRQVGVKRGERVLHVRSKSADAVVGMLGILMAGGAYVPVDPETPAARRRKIEEDCRPIAIVGPTVDGSGPPAAAAPRRPDDLAAILYTSGSTGIPKGVCLTDANMLHFVEWMVREFRVTADDRLANHAPYHFDLSVFDHYGAFRAGAAVVPVPKEHAPFPVNLARWIAAQRITIWYSVPFALVGLAERGALPKADLSALRLVLFAGEVFPMPSLAKLAAALPHAVLANLYGPTETNVCTLHRVTPEDLTHDVLPIGRAAPGFELRIEDGELLARGPGVMLGYWGGEPLGDRFYPTGDRVRRDDDGRLWLLGRKDRMVKSRGYRIELGDVETALRAVSGVREAAVVAVPDLLGQLSLVATISLEGDTTVESVVGSLKQQLPAYMVPPRIRTTGALPRTSTGKIDYPALSRAS